MDLVESYPAGDDRSEAPLAYAEHANEHTRLLNTTSARVTARPY